MGTYKVGDRVIYHKAKWSEHPTVRARDLHPAVAGDAYAYTVAKYWTVSAVPDARTVEVITRRGKVHQLRVDDPLLRKANVWQRVRHWRRFPSPNASEQDKPKPAAAP